jgi:Domain of unknown function (DUF2017)
MTEFRSRRHGAVYVVLAPPFAALLANLTRQLVELLRDGEATASDDPLEAMVGMDGPRDVPDDPALLRLLPDAHRDDVEVASEFRRLTERSLRDGKVHDATVLLETLDVSDVNDVNDVNATDGEDEGSDYEFELDPEQVRSWLRCITDLRLTLAERLEVTANDDEYWAALEAGDERLPVYEIYGWLGYLLESLLDAAQK